MKRFVVVAGNIGAGKTSLTERLGERLGWETSFESVSDNPYLADFYTDMQAWSFHLQVFFLGHRAQLHRSLAASPNSAIADRSIYEDFYIFARALHQLGNMTERDFLSYRRVYELVAANLPRPDLLLYLYAPVDVLLERIRLRGRNIETGITFEYLTLLENLYDEWLQGFELCPVLTIRSDDLDFVRRTRHLEIVMTRIRDRLSGKEDLILPP